MNIPKPTDEQCDQNEKVLEYETKVGYAIWYPQMGGYVGSAVAILDKEWTEQENGARVGGWIDVLVWHDGEFPFDDGENPRELHHCDPSQFVSFGETIDELNQRGKRASSESVAE